MMNFYKFKINLRLFLGLGLLFIVVFGKLKAQDLERSMFQYDIEQNLPSSEVYDSYQDSLGYLWFTTDRGIVKFDGITFKLIHHSRLKPFKTCFRLLPHQGRLLTNCIDGNIYEIKNDSLYNLFAENKLLKAYKHGGWFDILNFKDDPIEAILIPSDQRRPFKASAKTTRDYNQSPVFIDDSTKVFFGNISNLLRRKSSSDILYVEGGYSVNKNHNSDFWAANIPIPRFIYLFKGKNLMKKIHYDFTYRINNIHVINNTIWICTSSGLIKMNFKGEITDELYKSLNISSLILDYQNNLWITTLNKGLFRIPQNQIHELNITQKQGAPYKIISVKHFRNYNLIITSTNRYILIDNLTKKIINEISVNEVASPTDIVQLSDTFMVFNHMLRIVNNKLVLNTINVLNSANRVVEFGYKAYSLSAGRYLSIRHLGFRIYNQDFTKILHQSANSSKILCAYRIENNTFLLGTVNGMLKVNLDNPTQIQLLPIPGQDSSLRINDIKKINSFYILATSGGGIVITDFKQSRTISLNEGLPSTVVNKIEIDAQNRVWLATNQGLSCINFSNKLSSVSEPFGLYNLSKNTGLAGSFISDISINDEIIWVATNNGLNYFNTSIVNQSKSLPKTFIEFVSISGSDKSFPIFGFNTKLNLKYNENYFVLHFKSIFFEKPLSGRFYRYRLVNKGDSTRWSYTDLNEIQFTNLNPGEYIFEVAAQNINNEWGNTARIFLTISPHFTQTIWFKTIVIIFILALIAGVVFIIYRRQQKIQLEKLQLQEARIRTREADLNTLRNQMNPHFVFNALNSIQGLIYNKDFKSANDYLVRFSQLMRDTLQISKTQAITIANEVQYLNNYLQIESSRFDNLFTYNITIDEELEIEHRGIPSMLVQPIVENAVKHAFKEKTETGLISIRFESHTDENYMKVIIADNGIGIENARQRTPESKNRKSLGMQIVTERISLLQDKGYTLSKLSVQEEKIEGMNTVIVLTLPLIEIE